MRWSEEVLWLREELWRVLVFLEWHAHWWEDWRTVETVYISLKTELAEGINAYAAKQVDIRRSIHSSFHRLWRGSGESVALGIGADNDILDLQDPATYELLHLSEPGLWLLFGPAAPIWLLVSSWCTSSHQYSLLPLRTDYHICYIWPSDFLLISVRIYCNLHFGSRPLALFRQCRATVTGPHRKW